jgi:RNA polymerase sigma-70 factor (ECF subfamily)
MVRVQADDAGAFAELYDRHAARAFRVARVVCHDTGRAEDAVQEGFLSVWRQRAQFRPEAGPFQAWSMRIVHNRAIDSCRNAAARPQLRAGEPEAERPDTVSPSPLDEAIARIGTDAMLVSLRGLPEAQAEVITLAFFGELSHSEIATQLALSPGTVKGRMRLGLAKLRMQMTVPAGEFSAVAVSPRTSDRAGLGGAVPPPPLSVHSENSAF